VVVYLSVTHKDRIERTAARAELETAAVGDRQG
jgi:hypothetical protein